VEEEPSDSEMVGDGVSTEVAGSTRVPDPADESWVVGGEDSGDVSDSVGRTPTKQVPAASATTPTPVEAWTPTIIMCCVFGVFSNAPRPKQTKIVSCVFSSCSTVSKNTALVSSLCGHFGPRLRYFESMSWFSHYVPNGSAYVVSIALTACPSLTSCPLG
jgi:hypothetical protein